MVTAYLLRQEDGTDSRIDSDQQSKLAEESERGIFCRKCGHLITSDNRSIEVNGNHLHTFFNPAGIVYEIGCFSSAGGCLLHGVPSSEFSWFAGYTWRLALCSVCLSHLGWFFSSGDSAFFGLIRKNLMY